MSTSTGNNPASMTFAELETALSIQNGALSSTTLTLDKSSFTANIRSLIDYSYLGTDPILKQVQLESTDATTETVVLSGTSEFLNMPNLPVRLTATLSNAGEVHFTLVYTVIGATPDPVFWTLSKSIPGIAVPDPNEEMTFDRTTGTLYPKTWHPLDRLVFYNTAFLVTSLSDATDPQSGKTLDWGINFSSKVKPEGVATLVSGLMGQSRDFDVTGTIRLPLPGETTALLTTPYSDQEADLLFPWEVKADFPQGLPGVHLRIHLGFDYNLVAGKLKFSAEYLQLYTPYNFDWEVVGTQPEFSPTQAFTGTLEIPDAEIVMDFAVPFEWEMDTLSFISRFENLSLSALGDLAGLTGTGESLTAHLPQELQDLTDGLGALSLTKLMVALDFRNAGMPHIPFLSFAVGMPDINWEIWPGHFTVSALHVFFDFQYPFETSGPLGDPDQVRTLTTRVEGQFEIEGKSFTVRASSRDGFAVYAAMDSGETINLSNVINSFGDAVEVPDGLIIDLFRVGVQPGSAYNMALGMAGTQAWEIDLGPQSFTIADAYVNLNKVSGQSASAQIGGELQLGQLANLSVAYESPGDITLRSFFPEVDLMDLVETLVSGVLDLPNGMTFPLTDSSVLIKKQGQNYSFLLATEVDDFGTMAVQVDKASGQWGAAFGIDLYVDELADLPGLSALSALDAKGHLSQVFLVVSSLDRPGFTFPALAQFNNPKLNSNAIPTPTSGKVAAGLNLYTKWNFGNGDQETNTLLDLLGLNGGLDVTVSIPKDPMNGSRLYLGYAGKVLGKYDLDAQFGLQLSQGTPELFLGGTMTVPISGQDYHFDVALSALKTGIYFSGSMQGTVSFEGFQLSNLGLLFGYNWALIPSIGVMATIDTPDFHSSIAFLFDSGNPARSVMAGAISDLSLKGLSQEIAKAPAVPDELTDILDSIALEGINEFTADASLRTALNEKDHATVASVLNAAGGLMLPSTSEDLLIVVNQPDQMWSLTDISDNMKHYELHLENGVLSCKANAQIYLAPQGIAIGGFTFLQGFRVMGALSILGLKWTSDIEISKQKGISATSYLKKPLEIWSEKFFLLSDNSMARGPRFSLSTFSQPNHVNPDFRNPHFILDGMLKIMGSTATGQVSFSTSKFLFAASNSQSLRIHSPGFSGTHSVDWSVQGELGKDAGIRFTGTYDFQLAGKVDLKSLFGASFNMGKVSFNLAAAAAVEASFDGAAGSIAVTGSLTLSGTQYEFSFSMDGRSDDIQKMGDEVMNAFLDAVRSIYDDAAKWVGEIGAALEDLGDEIATAALVLADHFQQSGEEIGNALKDLGADSARIATELFNNGVAESEQAIADVLNALGYGADEVAQALHSALQSSEQAVAQALKTLGYGADEIADALKGAFSSTTRAVTEVLKSLGYSHSQIAAALKSVYNATAAEVAQLFKDLGYWTRNVARALKDAFGTSKEAASEILKSVGFAAWQISNALFHGYDATAQEVAEILKDLAFATREIAECLQNTFNSTAEFLVEIFASLNATAAEIAAALKDLYSTSAEVLTELLSDANYAVEEIAGALKDAYQATAEEVAAIFRDLDTWATTLANALKQVYGNTAEEMADILHGAGYEAYRIANGLHSAFASSIDEVGELLKGLGFGASDIANALHTAFDSTDQALTDALKALGFAAGETAQALKDLRNLSDQAMTNMLKAAGYAATQIGEAMRDVYHRSVSAAASLLRNAGFDSYNITIMMKDAFSGLSYQSAANILKGIGFSVNTVATRLRDQFNRNGQEVANLLRNAGFEVRYIVQALNQIMGKGAEDVTRILKDAGYAAYDAGEALHGFFDQGSEQAGKFLVNAGYEVKDIAKVLRKDALWDKGCDATGKILKKAGVGKSTVKSALRSAGWAKSKVEDVINSIF